MDTPRILVVDDNDDNRYTLTLYLGLEGYTDVTVAEDGEQAIAALQTDRFDLVLLDVMMPKVDGYQVLTWAREQPDLAELPVIMISALNEIDSVVRCIELGALDYLLKPFNPVLLRARLQASLEKKRLRDQVNAHLARLRDELETARRLQLSMLPQSFPAPSPDHPLDVFARMEPAREVGGDLYDVFSAPDGRFCVLIGDVAGKGMPAALFMARTRSLVRVVTELMGEGIAPSDIIARVNQELCANNADMMFVTLFFAMLHLDSGELQFCNAGHNPPYHLSPAGVVRIESHKDLILGVRRGSAYATGRLILAPGDALFLFTDGVTEANDIAGAFYGEARLEAVLAGAAGQASVAVIRAVSESLCGFVGAAEPFDDVAMLALRRLDPAALS
jgi:sigma-B regulation protein RsbU (phosphoserine phosphatase)